MKFGKYLVRRHLDLPEYGPHFMNYKQQKKLIKRLAAPDGEALPTYEVLQQNKATFFFQLERELEKVQDFYQQKESELEARLETLIQRKVAATSNMQGRLTKNSIAYISLYEGLQRFRIDLDRLEQFIELNRIAFSKVLKKWDKHSRSHTKELFLTRAVEVQPVFRRDVLVSLSDKSNECLLELEAIAAGDSAVVLDTRVNVEDTVSSPSDDLFNEFVSFACDPSSQPSATNDWVNELKQADKPRERITVLFLRAINSAAREDVLLALYNTKFVDLSVADEVQGSTVLHLCAVAKRRELIFSMALRDGANPNAIDAHRRTPLHHAAIHNRLDFVKLLLSAGADPNVVDTNNFTALHYAIYHHFPRITKVLVQTGAVTIMDNERSYIPLNFACQHGDEDAVKILIEERPNDAMCPTAEGMYPLHVVARYGFTSIIPILVEKGHADVNLTDKLNGWTALMYAASEGHEKAVAALLEARADWSILDESGYSALFYACWEGRLPAMQILRKQFGRDISANPNVTPAPDLAPALDAVILDSGSADMIPDLELPPPIIPLQRYGHNFLDTKNSGILQIRLQPSPEFSRGHHQLSAGRIVITTSGTRDSIPRNVLLPIPDQDHVQTFQVDSFDSLNIDFEVFPTFGTRLLAKASAIPSTFSNGRHHHTRLILIDALLRNVGCVVFSYIVVKPFPGRLLDISKYDTYWKSTSNFDSNGSLITGSSLTGTYHRVPIVITRDLVPVVANMRIDIRGVSLMTSGLTLADLQKLTGEHVTTLEEILSSEDQRNIDLFLPFPTHAEALNLCVRWPEVNVYVDKVLEVVFSYARRARHENLPARRAVFSSTNPEVCAVLNWKQPNFPVFLSVGAIKTDGTKMTANGLFDDSLLSHHETRICVSLREAAHYATTNNLMGLIVPADVLVLVPVVVPAIRTQGLVLVASGPSSSSVEGVDGVQVDNKLTFSKQQTIQ